MSEVARELLLSSLATPLGLTGSGRLRYGAAMGLHRRGEIGDAALECYRIASANDRTDPALLLAAARLPLPPAAVLGAADLVLVLLNEVDRYLSTLPGPGVAEVRAKLNAARKGPVGLQIPHLPPVLTTHLPAAIAAFEADHPALALALAAATPHLHWITYDLYGPEIGEEFARGHAYTTLIGEDAPIVAQDFDLGIFLIAPHVLYRDHHHAAPELYAPLTGPHGWRFGPDRPLIVKPAHHPVWNPPHQPHLTKVGPIPFLAIFGWTADVHAAAQVIPAKDWPELEDLRLA